jgi:hypothetical protein
MFKVGNDKSKVAKIVTLMQDGEDVDILVNDVPIAFFSGSSLHLFHMDKDSSINSGLEINESRNRVNVL